MNYCAAFFSGTSARFFAQTLVSALIFCLGLALSPVTSAQANQLSEGTLVAASKGSLLKAIASQMGNEGVVEKAQNLIDDAENEGVPFKKRQSLEAAIKMLEDAVAGDSKDAEAYYTLGVAAVKMQEVASDEAEWRLMQSKAIDAFEKAVSLNPQHEHAWADLAEVYFSHSEELCDKDPEESIRLFNKTDAIFVRALAAMPNSNLLWYLWASDYAIHAYNVKNPERRELREKAAVMFEKAIEFMKDDEYAWRMLAKVWWRIADDLEDGDKELNSLLQKSHDTFLEAYKITPKGSAYPIAELGALLGMNGDYCRKYLEKARDIGELDADELMEAEAFTRFHKEIWFKDLVKSVE